MKYFFICLLILICAEAKSQTSEDAKHFSGWIYMEKSSAKNYASAKKNTSLEEHIFSAAFLFYKQYISSQDKNACTFSPSCSEYALQSIKKEGIVLGMMSGFDRISRCHNLSREKYHILPHTHLLYDPVE